MRKEDFAKELHHGMEAVQLTPQIKRKTLDLIAGKEQPVMKRKLSMAVVLTLVLCLLLAAAVAAVHRAGLMDFIGRYGNIYVPEDAQEYVQTNIATIENDLVTAVVRELYYDGKVSRMVVDVTPKAKNVMLLGGDIYPDNPWENTKFQPDGDEGSDRRPVTQVYQEGGYQAAYAVDIGLHPVDETIRWNGRSTDCYLNEDGTLTIYLQDEHISAPETMEATLRLWMSPWETPLTTESQLLYQQRMEETIPLLLTQTTAANEAYLCDQPVEVPSVGVRIDGLLIEVKPQEIYVTLDFTVTDRKTYDALEDGLWFEFIDPSSTAETPYQQRLKEGLTGSGAISPMDGDDLTTAIHYRQTEALGRNELHESYTLRAFDCWSKQRFETVTLTVKPATQEEVQAFLGK